jgi:hypothetical protein
VTDHAPPDPAASQPSSALTDPVESADPAEPEDTAEPYPAEPATALTDPVDAADPEPADPAAAPGAAAPARRAPGPDDAADPRGRFERWTSIFFLSIAVVTFLAALTVGSAAANDPGVPELALARLVGLVAVEIALLVVATIGLDRRLPWGRTVAVGLLLVLVATDVVHVLVDLTRGQVTIPLGGLIAVYLLSTRAGPLPSLGDRDRGIAAGIVVLAAFAQVAALVPGVVGP